MKRRQLLKLLGFAPPLWLAACKDKLPSTPTIVKGKIIDENGNPLEGAGLRLTGREIKGFSGTVTFSITIESDKDGLFKLTQIAPDRTEEISILPMSTDRITLDQGFGGFVSYILINGNYEKIASPQYIPRSSWGKTTIINYQFIPR